MKVLVTGSAGFIGSRVFAKLVADGHDVTGYDIVNGDDLLDLPKLEEAIKGKDVVFHIAAQADLTQMSTDVEAGRSGVLRNVEATHNVAYVCAKNKVWMIYASTVCVYGNLPEELHPANEDVALPNPSELYACSKYAAEWIVKGYGINYGMPYTIQRFATIYGEGMRPALGLHVFFRQAMRGDEITVHGDGKQDRTLTYVYDLADGIVAPLARPDRAKNQVFNLTAPRAISAIQMAKDVANIVEKDTGRKTHILSIPQRDNQTNHEDFDVSKAWTLLGWKARTSWDEGMKKTYAWMKTQVPALSKEMTEEKHWSMRSGS